MIAQTSRRKSKARNKPRPLSSTRPPIVSSKPPPSLSAKATRTLIRAHHQLHKARARAAAQNDDALVAELDRQIAAHGGLESYQLASKKGQSKERGGDSSRVLVEWLGNALKGRKDSDEKLRLLEVGALSTTNACSRVRHFEVTRIDLHSQEKGILQQDFMQRPLPAGEGERFDIISLSLVLNYVSEPAGRGEMLRRTTEFLTQRATLGKAEEEAAFRPCLFLVLPAACVLNSRYFTEGRLRDIMDILGYNMVNKKVTSKLVYYLWEYSSPAKEVERVRKGAKVFKKEMLNPGANRNNFTVTLN
ncbi:hypothetical protein AJ79_06657 [Helicocarpus griseus UAMH5409]|uniref:25S rRNA adenine-N(1) methyltransferase n=1 Tax=Helicocarpus griseus UAMH5409 TaxID=1447875 RepID=A0A2B7XBE8_9EURO|nr:hypothetical protein AJ79_06657 [Helicocarpus griseus UAMH5409]